MADAPGPLTLIDIDAFDLTPSAAVHGPLAQQFARDVAVFHPTLDGAHETLTAEQLYNAGDVLQTSADALAAATPPDTSAATIAAVNESADQWTAAKLRYGILQATLANEPNAGTVVDLVYPGAPDGIVIHLPPPRGTPA